jgi:uncharacterized protein (DUF1330 family)
MTNVAVFLFLVLGIMSGLSGPAYTADCEGPAYIVAFEAEPISVPDDKGRTVFINSGGLVFEGAGWERLSATEWNCMSDAEAALPKSGLAKGKDLPAYALFARNANGRIPNSTRVPEGCTSTAYVVGMYTVHDPEQYADYARALSASGLAPSFGMTIPFGARPPLKVSQGAWPDATTFNLTQWPCIDAFATFFFGDEYQNDILPLRDGAATYNLTQFTPAGSDSAD